jgi:CcmD family protein
MNPGPELGRIAVFAAYAVVLAALAFFVIRVSLRQKKLERKRAELKQQGGSIR